MVSEALAINLPSNLYMASAETLKHNFPVELVPLQTKTRIAIPNRRAVIRTDTNTSLGIVSTKYELLKHADVINGFRKALKSQDYAETIKLAKNGSQLYATYSLPQHRVEVRPGDTVSMQFIVRNSYDGTNALHIMLGAFRMVCTNGMIIGKRFFTFSQKHIGAEAGDIDAKTLRDKVSMIADRFTKALPVMQTMASSTVFHPSEYFDHKKVHIPKYLIEIAKEEYERSRGKTLWDIYNSMTWAITHKMKRENPAMSVRYGQIVWTETTKNIA